MKNIAKDILFVIIFIFLFHVFSNIFVLKGNGYGSDIISFYNLKRNSLDVIFFGSSHSYATFSPDVIENDTELISYNFSTQQQPIHITYHYMIESLKTQSPKYMVLEGYMLTVDGYGNEGTKRDAIDKMRFSLNKIRTINESVENQKERMSYYINLIKYHSRYDDLTLDEIVDGLVYKGINNRGFINLPENSNVIIDNSKIIKNDGSMKISKHNKEYLDKIINLTKKNNIKLIIAISPCSLEIDMQKKMNWIKKYAMSNNIEFINYNELMNELKLGKNDFYDFGHLSGEGANKVSKHFSKNFLMKK